MTGFPRLLLRLSSHLHQWLAAVGISAAPHSLALFCPKHASIHRTFVTDTSNPTPLAPPLLFTRNLTAVSHPFSLQFYHVAAAGTRTCPHRPSGARARC